MEKNKKRTWSKEQKLQILQEAKKEGVEITLRKHGIYPTTYYSWQKKYELGGEAAIIDGIAARKNAEYIRKLEDEVCLLKQLLAEQTLENALKDELLKKKYPWAGKKS